MHTPRPASALLRRCSSGSYFLTVSALSLILVVTIYYNAGGVQINQIYNTYTRLEWLQPPGHDGEGQALDIRRALEGKLTHIDQDDGRLVDFVLQSGLIQPPPLSDVSYNLKEPDLDPSMGQSEVVVRVLKNMTGGFFIECGALDGETRSNTLYLEKELGWSGLLVEADPSNFKKLQKKRRKAYAVNVCLATKTYPHAVMFRQQFNTGKISEVDPDSKQGRVTDRLIRVQCMPLHTLLLALNVMTVDYFSLDVEGAEFEVLRTIPFDKVRIRVLSVEYIHNSVPGEEIIEYMSGFGYRVEATVNHASNWANDYIFVHESVYTEISTAAASTMPVMPIMPGINSD